MATAKDLNRHSSSGISYARAARYFKVDVAEVKAYAEMAKAYNKEARAWAREYGYKEGMWKAPALAELVRDKSAAVRFGGVSEQFRYMKEEVNIKLQDRPKLTLEAKAEQYAANLIQALRNNPESAFPESDVSKAIQKLEHMSAKEIMQKSGGSTLEVWYGPNATVETRHGVVMDILEW